MDLSGVLKSLGFGKNAWRIYKVLLDADSPMLLAHIAKKAQLDRPEVYRTLSPLLEQVFVKRVSLGKRFGYSAEDPRRIHVAFKKSADNIESMSKTMSEEKYLTQPSHFTYFTGAHGIRAVFDDAIERMPRGGTFYRYTSERNLETVNKYLSPDYRARRDKKKLERLVISNPISGKIKKPRLERFIKFIPPETDLFDQNVIQLVYADSIAFINLTTEEAYIIRDSSLARFQAVIFKQLYKKI